MATIVTIMEFIFRFADPRINLIIFVLMMFALWFALGGLATLAGNLIKRIRSNHRRPRVGGITACRPTEMVGYEEVRNV